MDSTCSKISTVKHQVYLKNRALMYATGILLFGTALGFGYLFYLEASAAFAFGFVIFISIVMLGLLRLDFGKINHMIEVTPLWQDSWHYLIFNQLGGSGVDSASLFG